MFNNVGWGEILVLVVVGLVVLGPERLPGAIRWSADALRQARDYLSNATSQLRDEVGPDFEDLHAPLRELQKLRGMTPRAMVTKHLLDGDDSLFSAVTKLTETPAVNPVNPTKVPRGATAESSIAESSMAESATAGSTESAHRPDGPQGAAAGPPFDQDAT